MSSLTIDGNARVARTRDRESWRDIRAALLCWTVDADVAHSREQNAVAEDAFPAAKALTLHNNVLVLYELGERQLNGDRPLVAFAGARERECSLHVPRPELRCAARDAHSLLRAQLRDVYCECNRDVGTLHAQTDWPQQLNCVELCWHVIESSERVSLRCEAVTEDVW